MKIFTTIAFCSALFLFSTEAKSGDEGKWKNVSDCGEGLTYDPSCQLKCLEIHNYDRELHGSQPLRCDSELAKSAQQWTDKQARRGEMHHSEWTDKFTESISWKAEGWEGMAKMESAIAGAVRSWYSEIKNNYDYITGKSKSDHAVGHFQAVVWRNITNLGCGIHIRHGDGTYVTAHYSPASHANTDYHEIAPMNVKPRKQPDPTCKVRSSDRVLCDDELKAPYVTPYECIRKGCCYDDMFMSEPSVQFYSNNGRKWCFKPKIHCTHSNKLYEAKVAIGQQPTENSPWKCGLDLQISAFRYHSQLIKACVGSAWNWYNEVERQWPAIPLYCFFVNPESLSFRLH